jgi:hypothetical protein
LRARELGLQPLQRGALALGVGLELGELVAGALELLRGGRAGGRQALLALHLAPRGRDVHLARLQQRALLRERGLGLRDVGLRELRVQAHEELAPAHALAELHVQRLDLPADLRAHVHARLRLQDARGLHHLRHVRAGDHARGRRLRWRGRHDVAPAGVGQRQQRSGQRQPPAPARVPGAQGPGGGGGGGGEAQGGGRGGGYRIEGGAG